MCESDFGTKRHQSVPFGAGSPEIIPNLVLEVFAGEAMHPPDPEMRSPAKAATLARANRKPLLSNTTLNDEVADRQASRIARLFLVGYATAATIAWLAYGVAR